MPLLVVSMILASGAVSREAKGADERRSFKEIQLLLGRGRTGLQRVRQV
jgi:hypothetical protein